MPLSMVARRSTAVFIVDLDGTLLTVNSFPRWALFITRAPFLHLNAVRRAQITTTAWALLAARKARLISHEALKWRLQRLWQNATAGDRGAGERAFISELLPFVRKEFAPLLARIVKGEVDAVLATAAAGDYAYSLGDALGFSYMIATPPWRGAAEPSTVGSVKRDAVLAFLQHHGWLDRPRVLFTDHDDDLPLIRICQTVYWFGSENERTATAQRAPDITLQAVTPMRHAPSPLPVTEAVC